MAGKCGKDNCGNKELAFLASAIKKGRKSRRRRLQMQLALNDRRRCLNLACLMLSLITKGTSLFLVPLVPVVGFFKIHLFCNFLSKVWLRSTPPNCRVSNPLHSRRFQIRNTAYRSGLSASKYISCSRNKRNTSLPAILFRKIRTSCVRMTKIGSVQNSGKN